MDICTILFEPNIDWPSCFPNIVFSTRIIDHINTFLLEFLLVAPDRFHSLINNHRGFEWSFEIFLSENISHLVSDTMNIQKVGISSQGVIWFVFFVTRFGLLNGLEDVFIIVS